MPQRLWLGLMALLLGAALFMGRGYVGPFVSTHAREVLGRLNPGSAAAAGIRSGIVTRIIDGDSIVVEDREEIRLLGIDTPEFGRPFFHESTARTRALLYGKEVRIKECRRQPRDKYGRTLALIYADKILVNAELVKEGLARAYHIPPCGSEIASDFRRYQRQARDRRFGFWATYTFEEVFPPRQPRRRN
ncbi:MAG: thermonuclease family protein [Deltaproteobacteria bacterium]|nr:thermonuclease family protein [Deltaproteobacteria bacterium]